MSRLKFTVQLVTVKHFKNLICHCCIKHYVRYDIKSNYQASDRMASATYDDDDDDDDLDVILMMMQFNKVYLRAESTAVGPITERGQTTYEVLK